MVGIAALRSVVEFNATSRVKRVAALNALVAVASCSWPLEYNGGVMGLAAMRPCARADIIKIKASSSIGWEQSNNTPEVFILCVAFQSY